MLYFSLEYFHILLINCHFECGHWSVRECCLFSLYAISCKLLNSTDKYYINVKAFFQTEAAM